MAAVYLHNALYIRTPPRDTLAHNRTLSTISNTTLHTTTTHHSQPTEPLLHSTPISPTNTAYYDQISRQPRNPDGTPARLRWDDPLALHNAPPAATAEKGRFWRLRRRKPMGRWKRIRLAFEMVIAAWATYNAVRYFIAFPIHSDVAGQTVCLALGTSTGIAFALALCSAVLSMLRKRFLAFGLGFKNLSFIRSSLQYIASFCVVGPAVVNFALVLAWRNTTTPRLDFSSRCRLDIDVIWSVTRRQCPEQSPSWNWWLVLSVIRLVLTAAIIVGYHVTTYLHPELPRRPRHRHLRSESHSSSSRPPSATLQVPPLGSRQPSDSTLVGDTASGQLSRTRLARSRSSGLSGEASPTEQNTAGRSTASEPSEADRDLTGFVDRFRSLLSQITQETEEALEIARSDGAPSPARSREGAPSPNSLPPSYSPQFENDTDDEDEDSDEEDDLYENARRNDPNNVFNLPPIPPSLGYNEFGLPYPPDENVRVLNGIIRRMPTIESMGSGEINASVGSYRHNGSMHTSSRPPTRATLLSFNSDDYELPASGPPSRANSLSARAELLMGMSSITPTSEHGELIMRPENTMMRRVSSPTSFTESNPSSGDRNGSNNNSLGDSMCSNATANSRATTTSYHTASTRASVDMYPPGLHPEAPSTASSTRATEHEN